MEVRQLFITLADRPHGSHPIVTKLMDETGKNVNETHHRSVRDAYIYGNAMLAAARMIGGTGADWPVNCTLDRRLEVDPDNRDVLVLTGAEAEWLRGQIEEAGVSYLNGATDAELKRFSGWDVDWLLKKLGSDKHPSADLRALPRNG